MACRTQLLALVTVLVAACIAFAAIAPVAMADPEPSIVTIEMGDGSVRLVGDGATIFGVLELPEGNGEWEGRPIHLSIERPGGAVTTLPDAIVDADGAWEASLAEGTFDVAGSWLLRASHDTFLAWAPAADVLAVAVVVPGAVSPPEPQPTIQEETPGTCTEACETEPDEREPIAMKLRGAGPKLGTFSAKCATRKLACPRFTGVLAPAEANLQVKFVVQRHVAGKWRAAGTSVVATTAAGTLKVAWKHGPRPKLARTAYRARWVYAGDESHLAAASPWVAFTLRR